jgi:ribonuclease-3
METDDVLAELADRLGYRFRRSDLVEQALTHASAAARIGANYERLEFLGDRVLGLAVAHLLYERFPDESEADIARRLAALVRRDALAGIARGLGLGRLLRMSRGEEDYGGRENPTILADACEALLGAIYLDGGYEPAASVVRAAWRPLAELSPMPPRDAKTMLQEWAQGRGLKLPEYVVIETSGPPHDPVFEIEARLDGHKPAAGKGRSRRAAEQQAAQVFLRRLGVWP